MINPLLLAAVLSAGPTVAPRQTLRAQLHAAPTQAADAGKPKPARSEDGGRSKLKPAETDAGTTQARELEPKPADLKRAPIAPEVKALVDRVQAFYEKTTDFTADFRQDYAYAAFKRTQTSTGKVVFKKPGMMRWDYEKPAPKTFVLAGDRVLALDPAALTLTKGAINTSSLSASVTFLFGKGKLADEFSIARVECAKCTGALLELLPLVPDPRFKKVTLEVDLKTAQVLRSIVTDPDGSQNAITFSNLVTNTQVTEAVFKLKIGPEIQVVDLQQMMAPKPPSPAPPAP
jgi:outer membrane lipoprotein carrier protein